MGLGLLRFTQPLHSRLLTEACALFLLCQDVPIPMFMQQKAESDWTEDEVKMAKEYERKVKELNEEREKFRKVGCMPCYRLVIQR